MDLLLNQLFKSDIVLIKTQRGMSTFIFIQIYSHIKYFLSIIINMKININYYKIKKKNHIFVAYKNFEKIFF